MTTLSRQELFDAAWDRPLVKVAAELGVTSTALKKTCRRHHIPTPARGYWTAVQAGAVLPKPKLSKLKDTRLETIQIFGGTPVPEAAKQAQHQTRAALETEPYLLRPQEKAQHENPILAATRKALSRAKVDGQGFLNVQGKGVVQMKISPEAVDRALSWLTALARLLEEQQGGLKGGEASAVVELADETIPVRIEEKTDRSPHIPTPKELKDKADRMRWGSSTDPWPKYDHTPSGRLSVILEANSYSGLRRTFGDGSTQRLETMTVEVIAAAAGHAALIKKRREEAQIARDAGEKAEARRKRIAAFAEREKRRSAFVDLIVGKLEERAKLAAVLQHIEAADPSEKDRLNGMASWLTRKLAETDALIGPVFLDISARHAKLEFDEKAAAAASGEPNYYYYPRDVALELWSIDEEAGQARMQSAYEWTRDAGLFSELNDLEGSV